MSHTLLESEFLMYGSVPQVMFPISTFSTRATITMSVWGLVTEKMACRENGGESLQPFCVCLSHSGPFF